MHNVVCYVLYRCGKDKNKHKSVHVSYHEINATGDKQAYSSQERGQNETTRHAESTEQAIYNNNI